MKNTYKLATITRDNNIYICATLKTDNFFDACDMAEDMAMKGEIELGRYEDIAVVEYVDGYPVHVSRFTEGYDGEYGWFADFKRLAQLENVMK